MLDYLSDTVFSAVPHTNRFALDPFYLAIASGLEMRYGKGVEGSQVAHRGLDELVQYARQRGGKYIHDGNYPCEPYKVPRPPQASEILPPISPYDRPQPENKPVFRYY